MSRFVECTTLLVAISTDCSSTRLTKGHLAASLINAVLALPVSLGVFVIALQPNPAINVYP